MSAVTDALVEPIALQLEHRGQTLAAAAINPPVQDSATALDPRCGLIAAL